MTALGEEWVKRQPGSFRAISSRLSVKDLNCVLRLSWRAHLSNRGQKKQTQLQQKKASGKKRVN